METTGQIIRRLRKAKGLSQEELAHLVGYSGRSTISKIENNEFEPNVSEAPKWAAALGVSLQEFMGYSETPEKAGEQAAHLLADPKVMRLVSAYLRMSPDQQAIIDNLCLQFAADE